jgi:flagellar motor component MotA
MTRTLPPNPSLEQFEKQAKDLRKGHQSVSTEAAERIKVYLPRLSAASVDEILQGDFSLQEAQHVIACEYGCKHWQMLCNVVAADLNVLAGLRDTHIQELLRQIDQEDCTRAFNGAGSIVRWRLMSNMSQRVRTIITEEIEAKPNLPAEERVPARHKILAKALEMAAAGQIEWVGGVDITAFAADVALFEEAIERVDFDLLAGLDDRGAQTLLRMVDQVRERFLRNMSARVRGFIESEIELSQADSNYSKSVRRRILIQTGGLAARGLLQWPTGNASMPEAQGAQYAVSEDVTELIARSLDQLTANDMADLWLGIANQARKEGILSLQPIEQQAVDPFLREALQLVVDGTEPDLLRDMLQTRLVRAILPQQETRCWMIIEAMMAIQSGDNSGVIRHKMATFYLASSDAMQDNDRSVEPTTDELAAQLQQTPVGKMNFDQVADLLTDLGLLARNEHIAGFKGLPAALEDKRDMSSEVLRRGLELLLAGAEPNEVMNVLESMVATRLGGLEKAHRMIIEGVAGTQAGRQPEDIVEAVRQVAV